MSKKTCDGIEQLPRMWYYILEFNDQDNWETMERIAAGKRRISDLTDAEFRDLFATAVNRDQQNQQKRTDNTPMMCSYPSTKDLAVMKFKELCEDVSTLAERQKYLKLYNPAYEEFVINCSHDARLSIKCLDTCCQILVYPATLVEPVVQFQLKLSVYKALKELYIKGALPANHYIGSEKQTSQSLIQRFKEACENDIPVIKRQYYKFQNNPDSFFIDDRYGKMMMRIEGGKAFIYYWETSTEPASVADGYYEIPIKKYNELKTVFLKDVV